MKVLIVEEALKTLHGHWFQYISDIVNGGREAGNEMEVAVHKDACPEILRSLPCRPILSSSVFEKNSTPANRMPAWKRVLTHNLSLYRDLRDFFKAGNSYDIVIATTTRLDHLLAYEMLHLRFRKQVRQWILIFIDAVGTYSPDYSSIHFAKKLLPLKLAMKLAAILPNKDRFRFVTESAGLSRRFEKFSGRKFDIVPHVTQPQINVRSLPGSQTKVLGTFGFTRYDKGLDILQAAIKGLAMDLDAYRFVIQWTGDYQLPDGSWTRQNLQSFPNVEYIPPFTSSDQYYDWLAKTDLMVLPYRKDFYYDRLSRVAIDAAQAGIPIIYPEETWLEEFVQNHAAGIGFQPENAASLAGAIKKGVENFSELKAQADSRKAAAIEAFSARKFFEVISA